MVLLYLAISLDTLFEVVDCGEWLGPPVVVVKELKPYNPLHNHQINCGIN